MHIEQNSVEKKKKKSFCGKNCVPRTQSESSCTELVKFLCVERLKSVGKLKI